MRRKPTEHYDNTRKAMLKVLSKRYADGKDDLVSLLKEAFDAGYRYTRDKDAVLRWYEEN